MILIRILIGIMAVLTLIPRVIWADIALASELSQGDEDVTLTCLSSIQKRRRKIVQSQFSLQQISRKLRIGNSSQNLKNLMIYINPDKKFSEETEILAKLQIDNSFDLGWKKNDIILVTNFDYEYKGIKAKVISGDSFFPYEPEQTKTTTIPLLSDVGIIEKDHLYWLHDFDAFQMETFDESDLDMAGADLALTDYGWNNWLNTGSIFLRHSAKDFFELTAKMASKYKTTDEAALFKLIENNINNINGRFKKLNITYNFNKLNVNSNYNIADKPIKIIHFHPISEGKEVLNTFISAKNDLGFPIATPRLIGLFKSYGIG